MRAEALRAVATPPPQTMCSQTVRARYTAGTIGTRQAPSYVADDRGVQVRLDLERCESVFVVLNPSVCPEPHLVTTDADEVLRDGHGQIVR